MGREWGARREELVFHGDVLQWCRGLVWLEFWVSHWALGWVLHPSALGLSQLVFPSPSYHTGTYNGAPSLFPPAPHLPPAAKPTGANGQDSHGSKPVLCGICEQPRTFWGSANPVCLKSHPLQLLGFWKGWRMVGCVPTVRRMGWWHPSQGAPCHGEDG